MTKKYLYISALIVIMVAAGGFFYMNSQTAQAPENNLGDLLEAPVASSSPSVSPSVSRVPGASTPTPSLNVSELKNYEQWVIELYPDNRWLALNADCTEMVPSGVTYKNNTLVMLDNTASKEPRVLKIGDKEYNLQARGWYLTTLSSSKLPASLRIDCGPMELGRIDLNK